MRLLHLHLGQVPRGAPLREIARRVPSQFRCMGGGVHYHVRGVGHHRLRGPLPVLGADGQHNGNRARGRDTHSADSSPHADHVHALIGGGQDVLAVKGGDLPRRQQGDERMVRQGIQVRRQLFPQVGQVLAQACEDDSRRGDIGYRSRGIHRNHRRDVLRLHQYAEHRRVV